MKAEIREKVYKHKNSKEYMKKSVIVVFLFAVLTLSLIGMVSAATNCTVKEDCYSYPYPAGVVPPTCGNVYSCLNGQCVIAAVDCTTPSNLSDYYNSVNYSCNQDSDCVIKDVHKCCGVDYRCVNKNAFVYPDFVKAQCAIEGVSSTCDVNLLQACKCENNKCVEKENETDCKNLYWFDNDNKNCSQKQFCGMYMYLGLQTFDSKTQCEKALNETKESSGIDYDTYKEIYCRQLSHPENWCDYGNIVEDYDNYSCPVQKCMFNLSNGRKAEIKIMPETASEMAIERLGELNFTIELKEVGKGDDASVVYELTGNKEGKFLGIFKIIARVQAQVDAETGDVKVIKPWWSFLATRI